MYTEPGIDALAKAVADAGRALRSTCTSRSTPACTGSGCTPDDAVALAAHVAARDELGARGRVTHLAVADEPGNPYTTEQLARFDAVLDALAAAGLRPPLVHAANSAGLLTCADARYDLVRVGIAAYGLPPAPALADATPVALRPRCRCAPGSRW